MMGIVRWLVAIDEVVCNEIMCPCDVIVVDPKARMSGDELLVPLFTMMLFEIVL